MKTIHLGKYFLSLSIMAFLLLISGNAFGTPALQECDYGANNAHGCTGANNMIVVSPYWQVDAGSYTFIAVTHTSLSGMASQIGVHMSAYTSTGGLYDVAESFTVQNGATERLFIVPANHATINLTAMPTSKFMTGTSDFTYGKIIATPVMTHPHMKWANRINSSIGAGFRDITMLSYWGSVIVEANSTGFAMEFIGDMNESSALVVQNPCTGRYGQDTIAANKLTNCGASSLTDGSRRDYIPMSTGLNLQ